MFTNGSPISAFAVYKQKNKKKKSSKSDMLPVMKKRKIHEFSSGVSVSSQKDDSKTGVLPMLKTSSTSKPKQDKRSMKSTDTKPTKKLKKNKKIKMKSHINEDEPPLLVPIASGDYKNDKYNSKTVSNEVTHDASFSYLINDLNKTDPSPEGYKLFKWLIASISPADFFDQFWEKEILFVERNSPSYYKNLLTTQRLDDIFREYPLYYTRNVDVVSYENGKKEVHNEEGRVVASALYDYYSNGCSIRILNPQTYDQRVHLLIATLQEYFGTMVGTNVYLTPPGSQGFAPHFDDIEAFILQLEGRKHWKLYRPKDADILARNSSPNFSKEEIGEPLMEVTLNAGDLLYFPRGTIHEGRTDENAHSLHITVSVYQHTAYVDLLEHVVPAALQKAAMNDINFRAGLPLNYLKQLGSVNSSLRSDDKNQIINKVKHLMKKIIDYIDVDTAADKLGRKFIYDSMPPVLSKLEVKYTSKYDGDYLQDGQVCNRAEIGMDTEVRLVRYYSIRLVLEKDNAKIYYNTENAKYYHGEEEQFLVIDNNLTECITDLQLKYPNFTQVEKLSGRDNIAKAQLVSDLWERGLLVTNGPLPSFSDDMGDELSDDSS